MNSYSSNATLLGVLDYMLQQGQTSRPEATIELEEFLDLTNRLVPLQSFSYAIIYRIEGQLKERSLIRKKDDKP